MTSGSETGRDGNAEDTGKVLWLLEHSEVTKADRSFVWCYWSDVANWDDPPATFVLHGEFDSDSRGETRMPGHEPVTWFLGAVQESVGCTIESQLDGAVLLCQWSLTDTPEGDTRLTQRVGLRGESTSEQAAAVEEAFAVSLEDGMKRIVGILDRASARRVSGDL